MAQRGLPNDLAPDLLPFVYAQQLIFALRKMVFIVLKWCKKNHESKSVAEYLAELSKMGD